MTLSDPVTFARAYQDHAAGAYRAALRILPSPAQAQDVVQDVFVRLWRDPQRFDARRGDLGSYLRLMARSRALDLWRERQAAGRASDRLATAHIHEPRVEERPAQMAERESERRTVRAALGGLPHPQREAIVLAYWGGLTADEIARRVNVPLGTAKSRIRLGLAKLRAEFGSAADPIAA
jgi:RNA polymerase sigma-70 factor (ECF subfamily)